MRTLKLLVGLVAVLIVYNSGVIALLLGQQATGPAGGAA